jgi:hypothetical protein
MVRPEGFEPPTYGFEARRSIQLSYGRMATRIDITVAATPGPVTLHHSEPSPATQAADIGVGRLSSARLPSYRSGQTRHTAGLARPSFLR